VPAPPPPAAVQAPAAAPTQPDPALLQWQQHAQKLAAQRDAALAELEATRASQSDHALELVAAREEAASFRTEKDVLERKLAELQESAAADDGHLAAATARLADLESAASRAAELDAELAAAREDAARVQMEKVALEAAHESMAAHTADLEERVKQLEAANAHTATLEKQLEQATAQISDLEAERKDVLNAAKALGDERRRLDHADDPAHLLFVPGREGYRLVEQEGPPPAPGSTLEVEDEEGTAVTLTVAKIGASPLPGTRLACAYLVVAP
jgi:DNA repair exonuclease SbcCD ATPase subunit